MTLLDTTRHWHCPACGLIDVTREPRIHTRFHTCRRQRGLTMPMLPVGTRAKVTIAEREDYIGEEKVATDAEGRPVQSVITERDDGQDVAVFAPTATMTGKDL